MVVDLDESRNSEWKQQRVPLLRDEAPRPSYTSMLGSILCNTFFFFLEGAQHELSKYADSSKFFWVVKCQTDGNKRLGIY